MAAAWRERSNTKEIVYLNKDLVETKSLRRDILSPRIYSKGNKKSSLGTHRRFFGRIHPTRRHYSEREQTRFFLRPEATRKLGDAYTSCFSIL